jgi:predicted methyltransferase
LAHGQYLENIMTCMQAVLSLLLVSPCSDGGGPSSQAVIAAALAQPARLESDRVKDPLRRPDEVLAFFEIRPGMRVLDLFSGSGYYTEILSSVVGPAGSVVAHNNAAYLAYVAEELDQRYSDNHLKNVERLTAETFELDLPPQSFDAAFAILTWHDFYGVDMENGWPAIDVPALTTKLCAALKPGAVLGVIDHVANAGADPWKTAEDLHRIDPDRIRADLAYEGELSVLRNSTDDHNLPMSDPSVRGKTDQVMFKFRKKR